GRYLLDLHGESDREYVYSDALCNALQVINHLQDCGKDYTEMDRVYLPEPWLKDAGANVEDLSKTEASSGVRNVIDQCLEGTRELLVVADKLPGALKSRRLAMESAVILKVAHKLVEELSNRDPLAERVELTKAQYVKCTIWGCVIGLTS
ncbi:MAG: squalene/phytoene synthase family protein, partial [Hyphomicrobiales bacterium]